MSTPAFEHSPAAEQWFAGDGGFVLMDHGPTGPVLAVTAASDDAGVALTPEETIRVCRWALRQITPRAMWPTLRHCLDNIVQFANEGALRADADADADMPEDGPDPLS